MADKITANIFAKGRNTDIDKSKIGIEQYFAAYNLELVGSGKYTSLQNINGTTDVKQIIGTADIECPGVFSNKYLIGGTQYNCLTIFTAQHTDLGISGSYTTLKIWCYNTETTDLYQLYQQIIVEEDTLLNINNPPYLTEDRVIDAVNYPENGTDILYFTDNYNELRFLKCEIPSPYSANFLSDYDISLLRRGANGTIGSIDVRNDGTLLSGTYQFAYRCLDPVNKRFTKWSTLTIPVHVYQMYILTSNPSYSGVGLVTSRSIRLTITPSFDESSNLDYVQLAVIENVGPTRPTTASLLEITPLTGTSVTFNYKNNARIGTVSIDDIVVDQAQIKKVKTLTVKQNRLFGGNVEYAALDFDNGTPEVVSGTVKFKGFEIITDPFASDDNSSNYIGHWRNEVYRYGVVYTDKFGNRSEVSPLDMSGVTGNRITSGLKDFKFADRSFSNDYALFASNGILQSLGLTLTLDNHPTWARSIEIVRVPRKKDILFQTPLVPMMTINGVGALDNYPTNAIEGTSSGSVIGQEYPNAQPMTASSMLVPKNMMWPELRTITKKQSTSGSGDLSKRKGEVFLDAATHLQYNYASIFPAPDMYGDTPFVYTGSEKIDYVDYALLKLNKSNEFTTTPVTTPQSTLGDFIDTSVSGSWYAIGDFQYYFDSGWVAKSIASSLKNLPIADYVYFDNFGETKSLAGNSIMDYASMQTTGINLGYQPNIQRMGVIRLKDTQNDVTKTSKVFAGGTLNAYSGGAYIVGSSGPKYDSLIKNSYITAYSDWTNNAYSSAVPIVNVKLGLGDDRYGDINSQHEYISTGAKYTFSDSQVATLESSGSVPVTLDIFGGDCFVGPHLFKICDSTYSVISQNKYYNVAINHANNVKKWDTIFDYKGGAGNDTIAIPVAVKNCGQFIQVILESEYNGSVRDIDNIQNVNTIGIPFYNITKEEAIRTPLTYKYNLNLSRQNDQKVFFPKLQYSFEQDIFSSRVFWTDIKIYNSDQAGFDVVKVSDFMDLEEKRYGITKLAVAGDNLYAIQQQGVVYLPTGEGQIEQTDGNLLAIRTGEVIGRPIIIDSFRGSQHLRGIVETGGVIFIPDNINRTVYVLAGQQLKPITEDNDSTFRTMFANKIAENKILGIYDPIRHEYWLADTESNICEVFNESGIWVGNYEFTGLAGGVSCNQGLYLIGKTDDLSAYTMYTGAVNQLFGTTVVPRVEFCINPDDSYSKTFDNIMLSATERLSSMDFVVERESSLGNQTGTITLDNVSIEGNYRIKIPRDSVGARMRGLRMLATIKWKNTKSALQAAWTRYRLSSRTPF